MAHPAWAGDETRRRYRLETGERVCNGAWSIGVSDEAVRRIRTRHKESEISGGNGWNLTLLATLLLSGDLDTDTHAGLVQEDLEALGLTARRIEWVTTPIREYPPLLRCFLTGIIPQVSYSATTIVGTLSSMSADRRIPEEIRTTAGLIAGDMILGV